MSLKEIIIYTEDKITKEMRGVLSDRKCLVFLVTSLFEQEF